MDSEQLDWSWLTILAKGMPLHSLSPMLQLDGDLYKIATGQYCIGETSDLSDEPELVSLLWTTSDGEARRVYLNEIESDGSKNVSPPRELLPLGADGSYVQTRKLLHAACARRSQESASYRIMTDSIYRLINRFRPMSRCTIFARRRSWTKNIHMPSFGSSKTDRNDSGSRKACMRVHP